MPASTSMPSRVVDAHAAAAAQAKDVRMPCRRACALAGCLLGMCMRMRCDTHSTATTLRALTWLIAPQLDVGGNLLDHCELGALQVLVEGGLGERLGLCSHQCQRRAQLQAAAGAHDGGEAVLPAAWFADWSRDAALGLRAPLAVWAGRSRVGCVVVVG